MTTLYFYKTTLNIFYFRKYLSHLKKTVWMSINIPRSTSFLNKPFNLIKHYEISRQHKALQVHINDGRHVTNLAWEFVDLTDPPPVLNLLNTCIFKSGFSSIISSISTKNIVFIIVFTVRFVYTINLFGLTGFGSFIK